MWLATADKMHWCRTNVRGYVDWTMLRKVPFRSCQLMSKRDKNNNKRGTRPVEINYELNIKGRRGVHNRRILNTK